MAYNLSYAGVPLLLDKATMFRVPGELHQMLVAKGFLPASLSKEEDFIDELNRRIPFLYLNDFSPPQAFLGRTLDAIAHPHHIGPMPGPGIRINDFYYPNGAARWGVFRGLATTRMVERLVSTILAGGSNASDFIMEASLQGAGANDTAYRVTTQMYMLPPRLLGETQSGLDGLYLITLVDERWYWQYKRVSLRPTDTTTWDDLLDDVTEAMGITVSAEPAAAVYLSPEPDSQLWTNCENAGILLDAIAWNTGRILVRKLDGTLVLESNESSASISESNRGEGANIIRFAGGNMFAPLGESKAGDLNNSKNAVLPAEVEVTFPRYVTGDDPVPHFLNTRTMPNHRQSVSYEDTPCDTYNVTIALQSGGPAYQSLQGYDGKVVLHSTAKALMSGEISTITNSGQLYALARQMANDYFDFQTGSALDEVYPGTFNWEPEGINDIIWTYSAKTRQAATRVQRAEWNQIVNRFQHSTGVPKGVGGPSVAQTWRDQYGIGGTVSGSFDQIILTAGVPSGSMIAALSNVRNLPTDQKWRGEIGPEAVLFTGTSGGVEMSGGYRVDISRRGIDNTTEESHNAGNPVVWTLPNTTYGNNLITHGPGTFVFQEHWTSGGIASTIVLQRSRDVMVLCGDSKLIKKIPSYSGRVMTYDPTAESGKQFASGETCWIQTRNLDHSVSSGRVYDGQLEGYSAQKDIDAFAGETSLQGPVAPLYTVDGCCEEEDWCVEFSASLAMHVCVPAQPSPLEYLSAEFGTTPRMESPVSRGDVRIQSVDTATWNESQHDYPLWPNQLLQVEVDGEDIELTGVAPPGFNSGSSSSGGTGGGAEPGASSSESLQNALMIEIMNTGSDELTIKHNDSRSQEAHRFSLVDDDDVILKPRDTMAFKYNKEAERWFKLFFSSPGEFARVTVEFEGNMDYNVLSEITWDEETEDTDEMWDVASPAEITINTTGLYFFSFQETLGGASPYVRRHLISIVIKRNTIAVWANNNTNDTRSYDHTLNLYSQGGSSTTLSLVAGDSITVEYKASDAGYEIFDRVPFTGMSCMGTYTELDTEVGEINSDLYSWGQFSSQITVEMYWVDGGVVKNGTMTSLSGFSTGNAIVVSGGSTGDAPPPNNASVYTNDLIGSMTGNSSFQHRNPVDSSLLPTSVEVTLQFSLMLIGTL